MTAKVIGINGSPRTGWNSDTLLSFALQGAMESGAETERIKLWDIRFSGCSSCFACKLLGPNLGRCGLKDELTPIIERIRGADLLIISTPVYFADVPGQVRNLFERLWFPPYLYRRDGAVALEKRSKVLMIYTMNTKQNDKYASIVEEHMRCFDRFFGSFKYFVSTNTLQYDDYSRFTGDMFSHLEKKEWHEKVFPDQCDSVRRIVKDMLGG